MAAKRRFSSVQEVRRITIAAPPSINFVFHLKLSASSRQSFFNREQKPDRRIGAPTFILSL
jgi:hypothetical protein